MDISAEEIAAMQQARVAQLDKPVEPVVTPPVVTPPVVNQTEPVITEPVVNQTEPVVTPPVTPEPVLSFQEQMEKYLEENTGGKYKKFDEIKTILETPRDEFADDQIKHLNELAKKGIKIDREFFELENLDLDKDEHDPEELILQAMRRKPEFKGLSERTLRFELNKKYNIEEWIEKDDADLTDADLAYREIMVRDAHQDLEWLKKYKSERVFTPETNKEEMAQAAEQHKQAIATFEKYVDEELFAKVTSLSTEVEIDKDTKEVFEYKLSEADRKQIADTMKLSAVDASVLVSQFAEKDAQGNLQINKRKVFEMLAKDRVFDEAVKNALKDGMALGAKKFVKEDLKNVNFKPQETGVQNPVARNEAEALALAIKASGQKLV